MDPETRRWAATGQKRQSACRDIPSLRRATWAAVARMPPRGRPTDLKNVAMRDPSETLTRSDPRSSAPPPDPAGFWVRNRKKIFFLVALFMVTSCGFYLWTHRSSYFHLGTHHFGPGDGEWLVESPDVHGLSSAKLADASALHERRLARRDCLLVVKDGVIVHEAYHNGGDADTLHYVESAGSVAAALLAGAAARHGLLDLDTPLYELGITAPPVPIPHASDPETAARERRHPELRWGAEWRKVTTRHLLSQTTGWGRAPAGTKFDLDPTGDVLAVVSKVLWATTGRPPADWAREHLTGPLGAPDFFNRRGDDDDGASRGDVSVAGGQMATCRDAARFGQLIVNQGKWLAEDGSVRVLVEPEFIAEMTRPAFPNANPQYGFLAWVHPGKDAAGNPRAATTTTKKAAAAATTTTHTQTQKQNRAESERADALGAAAPRGTRAGTGSETEARTARSAWDDFARAGDDAGILRCGGDPEGASPATRALLGADGPDFPVAVAMGRLGKFILAAPEAGLVVVSMGNTWGSSAECPSGLRELIDAEARIRRRAVGARPARPRASLGGSVGGSLEIASSTSSSSAGPSVASVPNTAAQLGLAPRASVGYDDVVVVRALWAAVGDAVTPDPRAATRRGSLFGGTVAREETNAARQAARQTEAANAPAANAPGAGAGSTGRDIASEGELGAWFELGADDDFPVARDDGDAEGSDAARVSVAGSDYDDSDHRVARTGAPSSVSAASRQKAMDDARAAQAAMLARATGSGDASANDDASEGHTGSCRCSCPPANGVGQCVNMRGVPEARCDSAQILEAARGFCPALGVIGECPAAPDLGADEGASGWSKRERSKRKGKRGGERRRSHARGLLGDGHADDDEEDVASVKISAARFSAASSRGLTVPPESPAFACSSSAGCEPSLGGASVESFLCQPLSFHSCSWHDELCDQRVPSRATRRAVRDRTPGAAADAIALTEPSAASYLGLRAKNENGDVFAATRKSIHQTRAVVAAITAGAVVALAAATRLARSGDGEDGIGEDGVRADGVRRRGSESGGVAADVESALVGKGTGRGGGLPSYGTAESDERVPSVATIASAAAADGERTTPLVGASGAFGSVTVVSEDADDDVAAEETPTAAEDDEAEKAEVTVVEEAVADETPAIVGSSADAGEDAAADEA